jgi:Flp pilus assembly protein TadG
MKFNSTAVSNRAGTTTVEFALTFPLLILLLFGAVELSHANMVLNATEAAAYEGARRGIIPGAESSTCINAAQLTLDIAGIRNSSIEVTPSDLLTSDAPTVRVTIDVPYASNTIVAPLFTRDLRIIRSCELTRERP